MRMRKNFAMVLTILMIGLRMRSASGVSLYVAEKPLSTEYVELRVVSRSKRDATSSLMAEYYNVTMDFGGKRVNARLKRQDVISGLVGQRRVYKRDWATYASDEIDGVFVVHRHESARLGLKIEGFMIHDMTPFLLQPHETWGGHVIHMLGQKSTNKSIPYHLNKKRRRRQQYSLLDGRPLHMNTKVITDVTMRELVRSRVGEQKTDFYIEQYYAMLVTFVNQRFASLRARGTNIYFLGHNLEILKTPIPGVLDAAQSSIDIERKATCAEIMAEKFYHMTQYDYVDQVMLLTGYDMLSLNGHTKQAMSKMNSGCLFPGARSMVRFTMAVEHFRLAAHASMIGFGVKTDGFKGDPMAEECKETSSYIMARNERTPFSISNDYSDQWWLYSECTNNMLRRYLANLSKDRWPTCLRKVHRKINETNFSGYGVTLQRQCHLFAGRGAVAKEREGNICFQGLTCMVNVDGKLKYKKYLPLPGTPCGAGKWCVSNWCIDIPGGS